MADKQEFALEGGCLCGAVRYGLAAPRVHYCHCAMCRKATGSAFAVLAWVRQRDFRWMGSTPPKTRRSSPLASRSFCPECGSPLALVYDGGDEVALHAGTLDEPGRFPPTYHYGIEGRLGWADCGRGLPGKITRESW